MRPTMKMTSTLLLAALPVFSFGCVQQDRYDNLLSANRSLKEQLVTAQDENATTEANLGELRRELAAATSRSDSMQHQIGGLEGELDLQTNANQDLMTRVSRLQLGPLPIDVEQALTRLAMEYNNVLSFDAGQGMLRFSSDFTFDLGSVEIKAEASKTLAQVARILNSTAAELFEVQVVGHTDNVPIRNPGTRAAHPTNLHLAVHRAIAVRNALVREGVSPIRTQIAGYGEFRPLVPNRLGGAAQNRRVEIFLVPMKTGNYGVPLGPHSAEATAKPIVNEPMK